MTRLAVSDELLCFSIMWVMCYVDGKSIYYIGELFFFCNIRFFSLRINLFESKLLQKQSGPDIL